MINEIKEKQLNKLKYFLECYFNMSCDYSELDNIINEYSKFENEEYTRELKEEIKMILLNEDIQFAKSFIKKYGMRTMTDDKVIWFMNEIINKI